MQASIAANTYVVSGHAENKTLQELLPGIINQLGPDNLANLKSIAESYSQGAGPAAGGAGGDEDGEDGPPELADGEDGGPPDLVDNFEDVSES